MPKPMSMTEIGEARRELGEKAKILQDSIKEGTCELTEEQITKALAGMEDHKKELDDAEVIAKQFESLTGTLDNELVPRDSVTYSTPLHAKARDHDEEQRFGFRDVKDQLLTIMNSYKSRKPDNRLVKIMNAAGADEHSTFSDPYGGFLIAPGFLPQLLQRTAESDPTEGRVTMVPVQGASIKIPARTDTTHTSSVTGGLTVSRKSEAQAGASSRMEVEQVELEPKRLVGVTYATDELVELSAVSIVSLLQASFAQEFGSQHLKEKISGTGAGEMEGVLNCPAKIEVAKEGGQAADTINGTNVHKMRARAWNYSNSIWLANHDCYNQLVSIHVAGTNSDVFLFAPGNGTDVPDTLLGRPIFFTEYAKTLGDAGDLILADWSQYLVGMRGTMDVASSIHVRFLEGENTFRFTEHIDGRCWWRAPITPVESSTTLSCVVTLAARA